MSRQLFRDCLFECDTLALEGSEQSDSVTEQIRRHVQGYRRQVQPAAPADRRWRRLDRRAPVISASTFAGVALTNRVEMSVSSR